MNTTISHNLYPAIPLTASREVKHNFCYRFLSFYFIFILAEGTNERFGQFLLWSFLDFFHNVLFDVLFLF